MQFETITQNGETYAMVPIDLLEDIADLEALNAALARGEEGFPESVWEALENGEPPLRVFRHYRKLTQLQLEYAAGVKREQISAIEGGKATGSAETLKKLAGALNVPMEDLV